MSVNQSALMHYGYDLVLALSQVGMNEKLKSALSRADAPDRYICAFDQSPSYNVCSLTELIAKTNGINPLLAIPNGANSNTDTNLQKLVESGLLFVIHTRIGFYTITRCAMDIVSFTGETSSVNYNLLHAVFEVGQIMPPAKPGDGYRWQISAQWRAEPSTKSRTEPWTFAVRAGLSIQPIADATQWPSDVKTEAGKYPGSTVSRLAFQLADAEIVSYPAIPGLQPKSRLHEALRIALLPQDAQDNVDAGTNIIGYWIKRAAASLSSVTAMGHIVSPYLNDWDGQWTDPPPSPVADPTPDQANAATFDLLCAVNNDTLPAPTPFRWNWQTARPLQSYHGAIAVNAATFVAVLRQQLDDHASLSCWQPVVNIQNSDHSGIVINGGATPTVTTMTGGSTMLSYRFDAQSSDSANGVTVTLRTSYVMDVDFNNYYVWPTPTAATTIFIRQREVMTLDVMSGKKRVAGNIVDYTLYQNFPLGVDADGRLMVQSPPLPVQKTNDSQTLILAQTDISLQWLQGVVNNITSAAQTYAKPSNVTPDIVTDFFFPFGEAFSFADVSFSSGLDLVGHITFATGDGDEQAIHRA